MRFWIRRHDYAPLRKEDLGLPREAQLEDGQVKLETEIRAM